MLNLKKLRLQEKLSQKDMAAFLDISQPAYANYERGVRQADYDTLSKLANYFNVTIDYLLGNSSSEYPTSGGKGVKIPVLGEVRAGLPIEAIENIIDYEEITQEMAASGEYFALKIKGDSMEPGFIEGDIVIVRKQSVVNNGDIAIVLVNGDEATVKKFYKKEDGITLMPSNSKYEPMFFNAQQVDELPVIVLGKVVELRRSL